MSKVRCFACHKIGHYAGRCPNKKDKKEGVAASVDTQVSEFIAKFEEFSLFACLSGIITKSA